MTINSVSKHGFLLEYFPKPAGEAFSGNSIFCGENSSTGPECINCNKPFLKIFDLDVKRFEGKADFGELERLILVFCWTCTVSQNSLFYKISDLNRIKLISGAKGETICRFPYDGYPAFFPEGIVEIESIPVDIQHTIADVNAGKVDELDVDKKYKNYLKPNHQMGGEPYLVEGEFNPSLCPDCEREMPFLASVADYCLDPRGFTGNDFVQIIYSICVSCKIIGAYQCCD